MCWRGKLNFTIDFDLLPVPQCNLNCHDMRLPECSSKNLKCRESGANQFPEYKNTNLYEPRREMCSVWLGADAAMRKTGWRRRDTRKAVAAFKIKLRRGANVHAAHAQPSTLPPFHAIECLGKDAIVGDFLSGLSSSFRGNPSEYIGIHQNQAGTESASASSEDQPGFLFCNL